MPQLSPTETGANILWRAGLLLYMDYIGMCSPKGYVSLAILVRNRVLILSILVSNRVGWLACTSQTIHSI